MSPLLFATTLTVFAAVPFWKQDPSAGLTRTKTEVRQQICTRTDVATADELRPGEVRRNRARGEFGDRDVVLCQERLLGPEVRGARDTAILDGLDATTAELVGRVASLRPDLAERTWLVEVFYPSAQVVPKIRFAAQNALVSDGLSVSDRTPALAAGDVEVLTRMEPSQAYPSACRRYVDSGSLHEDDVLLAIVMRDPRQTNLHAAVCDRGRWTWLQ